MNKLLPILLVVVLSGCGGKSAIEKCADNLMKKRVDISGSFQEKMTNYRGYMEASIRCEEFERKHPKVFEERFK
jgi:hypothetical protein